MNSVSDNTTPIITIYNHHVPDCGDPPELGEHTSDDPRYIDYFENEQGEQAIFVYDSRDDRATLQLGDSGWPTITDDPVLSRQHVLASSPVARSRADDDEQHGMILGQEEATWLGACLSAIEPMRQHAARKRAEANGEPEPEFSWPFSEESQRAAAQPYLDRMEQQDLGGGFMGSFHRGSLSGLAMAAARLRAQGELAAADLVDEMFDSSLKWSHDEVAVEPSRRRGPRRAAKQEAES